MRGEISGSVVSLGDGVRHPAAQGNLNGFRSGERVTISVRPERVVLGRELDAGLVRFPAEVSDVIFLGSITHVAVQLPGERRLVAIHTHSRGEMIKRGDRVEVGWWPEDALVLHDSGEPTNGEETAMQP